ncbi:MAG: DUF2087 domain-containing protein [Clostridiales bacterium]|nr:DUF2087 domain-containing protein [Clostridiales bacterium]
MNLILILKNFLDEDLRLKAFPAKRKMKIYALLYFAEKFEKGREYSEKEVGALLNQWHTFSDPATIRREMYDYGFLDRSRDGRVYKMSENQPTFAQLGLSDE